MVIEEKFKNVTFKDLYEGDIFRYGSINYLKIPPCRTEVGYDYNSYDLDNNDYCYFSDERQVTPVKAKLIIE